MKQIELTIMNEYGLHARPASLLANLAEKYSCDIFLEKDGKKINVKSIMSVLLLAAAQGTKVSFILDGEDEDEAEKALRHLVEVRKFDE